METQKAHSGKLFLQSCEFMIGATEESHIPSSDIPEVAFVGRSNVGKSSLLNSLTNRKNLARTSATPGCTRQLNFFLLGELLMLVDLPGYGYAKVSKSESREWVRLMKRYLRNRANLRRVCVLIDARRGIKESDEEMMSMLDETAVSYQIIFTKADKLKQAALDKEIMKAKEICAAHSAAHPEAIVTSARDTIGIEELRNTLAAFAY